jgi:hypothetical protein
LRLRIAFLGGGAHGFKRLPSFARGGHCRSSKKLNRTPVENKQGKNKWLIPKS